MRQFRTKFVVPAVAAGIMTLAGCGGPATAAPAPADQAMPGMSMPGMSMPPASGPVASASAAPVATNPVSIMNFAFSPATVTIKAGTTVTWTNHDQDAHTVSAMPGALSGAFHSQTLNTGQSYSYTFTTPGRFDYLCTIHPFMLGTVVVTP